MHLARSLTSQLCIAAYCRSPEFPVKQLDAWVARPMRVAERHLCVKDAGISSTPGRGDGPERMLLYNAVIVHCT